MSTDVEFQEQLAWGEEAEDIVYEYLIANNSGVVDLRKQKRDEGRGPRIRGTEGSLVLPDFGVYNKGRPAWAVDVKRKRSLYTYAGSKCFTVDNKLEQYKLAAQVMRYDYLCIVFFYEGRMYFYKADEFIGYEYKVNDYGAGNVYYFPFDKSKMKY